MQQLAGAVLVAVLSIAITSDATRAVAQDSGADTSQSAVGDPAAERPREWVVEQFNGRMGVFQQEGRGIQSQAGGLRQRGSEHAWIFQPIGSFRLRQNEDIVHDVTIPIDVVTAASPDALDAIASASRDNEAGSLDITTSIRSTPTRTIQLHWGAHFEEYWLTQFLGAAVVHSLADDNATLRIGFETILDGFDTLTPTGFDPGPIDHRFTASVDVSFSQLLSPTTIWSASYTFTGQIGRLETTYNSIPLEGGTRVADLFPRGRERHTLATELRHAFAETETYFALSYRAYLDSFDASAHTAQLTVTQYFGPFWARLHYRFHHQDAPWFWMEQVPAQRSVFLPRTGDSDLETLDAHEGGLSLRWFLEPDGALTSRSSYVQVGYIYYRRTNSLESHVMSTDFGFAL